MSLKSNKSSNHIKGFFEYLIVSILFVVGAYFINFIIYPIYIVGFPTNEYQLYALLVFAIIGSFSLEFILPFLDKYYSKPIPSLLIFIVEEGLYSTFFCMIAVYVYNFTFYPNIVENIIAFFVLFTIPVFGHELGHFYFAYKKNYKPVLIPLRLVDDYIKEDNPTSQTLALTVFHGRNSRLISSAGPMMNMVMGIVGVLLFFSDSFSSNTELVLGIFAFYNVLLFIYNIGEL